MSILLFVTDFFEMAVAITWNLLLSIPIFQKIICNNLEPLDEWYAVIIFVNLKWTEFFFTFPMTKDGNSYINSFDLPEKSSNSTTKNKKMSSKIELIA